MTWTSLCVDVDGEHAEALADALLAHGALAVTIEDADAGTDDEQPQYGEPGMFAAVGWQRSRVVALLAPDADADGLLARCTALADLPMALAYRREGVAEQDWVRLTQSQFDPIRVSSRLWIVPSWHQPPDPEAMVIVLDPGLAFGTGSHATTLLCLEWLEREVQPGQSVLDYGCGSGILAIAAAKFGAGEVVGIDIDPQAVAAAQYNAAANGVCARFEDATQRLRGEFDLVVANILANPLRALAPAICSHLREGGRLALSGILDQQSDALIAAYAPYLALTVADRRDGWVCLAGHKGGRC